MGLEFMILRPSCAGLRVQDYGLRAEGVGFRVWAHKSPESGDLRYQSGQGCMGLEITILRPSRAGVSTSSAFTSCSNVLVQVLDLYWRSPESDGLWCRSTQLTRTICSPLMADGSLTPVYRLAGRSASEREGNNSNALKDFRGGNGSSQGQNLAVTVLFVPCSSSRARA